MSILITFYAILKINIWHFTCLNWFIDYYVCICTCLDTSGLKFLSCYFNIKSNYPTKRESYHEFLNILPPSLPLILVRTLASFESQTFLSPLQKQFESIIRLHNVISVSSSMRYLFVRWYSLDFLVVYTPLTTFNFFVRYSFNLC